MKAYISKVTGLQVGFASEWVVLDDGEWRVLTTEELSAVQVEELKAEAERLAQEAKQAKKLALDSITVTTTSGNVFDGREKDVVMMSGAIQASEILALTEHQWKLHDNTVVTITIAELKEALALSMVAIGTLKLGA